jgi:hypothetical protein
MAKVGPRVASFREVKTTWVPKSNRIEQNAKADLTKPEYYSNGKRMSPTKMLCAIKK